MLPNTSVTYTEMSTKRLLNESGSDQEQRDQPSEKRLRARTTFASVIGEVVMVNSFKNLLEPMLRRVVNEELERSLSRFTRPLTRSQSLRIQALEPATLQLKFNKPLKLPIFTGTKIVGVDSSPLQILAVDMSGENIVNLPRTIKVEIVVMDGDFPPGDRTNWTAEEFDSNIVKERAGRRPLLAGEVNITLRNGCASIREIGLTDNSRWIRSRKFRLGARVVPGSYQGVRIKEALTEAFVVKEHRCELYQKHYPPCLGDEIWRLEKIGKDGALHNKLASEGVKTVQDFLRMYVVEPVKLRWILGTGMSEKIWGAIIKHATTFKMDDKRYIYQGSNYCLVLDPICRVEKAIIDGQAFCPHDPTNMVNRSCIENLVRQAYLNWGSLQEVDVGHLYAETALLTQGEMEDKYHLENPYQSTEKPFQQVGGSSEKAYEVESIPNGAHIGANFLHMTSNFITTQTEQVIRYRMEDTSSEGGSFMNGN